MGGFIERHRNPEMFNAGFNAGFAPEAAPPPPRFGAHIGGYEEDGTAVSDVAIAKGAWYEGLCAGQRARNAAEGRGPWQFCWDKCTDTLLQVVRVDVNWPEPGAENWILTCGHRASPRFVPDPEFSHGP
jgi:hypothetical protein